MIVKPDELESILLDRCLASICDYVDEICITQAGEKKNKYVSNIIKKYNGKESFFKWENDFSKARNFNFSQATGDYIFWCDSDDTIKGGQNLKTLIGELEPTERFIFCDYLYDFDEFGLCIIRHKKIRVIKNDGSFRWAGRLHEDLISNISEPMGKYVNNIEILHFPPKDNEEYIRGKHERNLIISQAAIESNPEDARNWYNYAQSLKGMGKFDESIEMFNKFISIPESSEDERYLAHLDISRMYHLQGKNKEALRAANDALSIFRTYPDAYSALGYIYFSLNDWRNAKEMFLSSLKMYSAYGVPSSVILYNPREYDFNPLLSLSKVYVHTGEYTESIKTLDLCLKIYPDREDLKKIKDGLQLKLDELNEVDKLLEPLKKEIDKKKVKEVLDNLPDRFKAHPKVCHLRNIHFVKKESSGKDLVYFCGMTSEEWNPDSIKTGIGGSEEAVINLTKEWTKKGWNVTVYANCGIEEKVYDGVTWRPFWMFNYRDKQDVVILWRHPYFADYDINCKKIFVDMHDCLPEREFLATRLKNISKIFVKSKFHRTLYPNIPDDKFEIIPNGVDVSLFEKLEKKQKYRMIYTSSPDRGLYGLLQMFPKIKEKYPEAELHIFYGWTVWDAIHKNNKMMIGLKEKILKLMEQPGIFNHGRVGHKEIAEEMMKSQLWVYPSKFSEIHCISAVKAQLAMAIPVTTTWGALDETVQWGFKMKVNEEGNTDGDHSFRKEESFNEFLELVDKGMKAKDDLYLYDMSEWARNTYNFNYISNLWLKNFY